MGPKKSVEVKFFTVAFFGVHSTLSIDNFIRELDVPPLGESNLMGPKKSVEVKFFTVAFFGVHQTLSIAPNVINW